MPELNVLRRILEKYGAQKVTRADLHTPCDVYGLDCAKIDKFAFNDEIDKAGFEFSNWTGAHYLNELAGDEQLVTPTTDIRDSFVHPDGTIEVDQSPEADTSVINAMLAGKTVRYGSPKERDRVQAQLKPGMISFAPDLDYMLHIARERNYVRAGNAILLAYPNTANHYGLLMEKGPGKELVPSE